MSKVSNTITAAAMSLGVSVEMLAGILPALRQADENYSAALKRNDPDTRYLFEVAITPVKDEKSSAIDV